MVKRYDIYGNGASIYESDGLIPYLDYTRYNGDHRYLVWVGNGRPNRGMTGQRKTYRTRSAAVRRAKFLAALGHRVKVSDRFIRKGDTGFLAGNIGQSYYRDESGKIHTGTFDEIQALLRAKGVYL